MKRILIVFTLFMSIITFGQKKYAESELGVLIIHNTDIKTKYADLFKEKYDEKSELFVPKDMFETSEQYSERKEKAQKYKEKVYNDIYQIEADFIANKIKTSYEKIQLKIDYCGQYDADKKYFPITINGKRKNIKIPLEEAKTFYPSWKNVVVKAEKQLKTDCKSYRIFNVTIIHPITNKEYYFSDITEKPMFMNWKGNGLITARTGIPDFQVSKPKFVEINGNGNNKLDAFESGKIVIPINNVGLGHSKEITAQLKMNHINGLTYKNKDVILNLKPNENKEFEFTFNANENIASQKIPIEIIFTEIDGLNTPAPRKFYIETESFKNCDLRIIDISIEEVSSKNNNNIINHSEQIKVKTLIKNIGLGLAKNVSVDIIKGDENILFIGGQTKKQIGDFKPGKTYELEFEFIVSNNYNGSQKLPLSFDVNSYGKVPVEKNIPLGLELKKGSPAMMVNYMSEVDNNIPKTDQYRPNTFALIVGNEDYSSYQSGISTSSNVPYAKNDAKIFYEYCNKTLGIPIGNINLMLDAESIDFNSAIDKLEKQVSNVDNAQVIFYFAGHGLPDEGTKKPHIIPVDVNLTNIKYAINLEKLYDRISTNSTRTIVFLDACFTGGAREQGLIATRGMLQTGPVTPSSGGTLVFSATNEYQTALGYDEKGHGMFTYNLLKTLYDFRGDISLGELSKELSKRTNLKSLEVNNKEQNPQTMPSPSFNVNWKNEKL